MKFFRSAAGLLALWTALAMPVLAQNQTRSDDPLYDTDTPPIYAMLGDLIVARPLMIGVTAIGAAVFLATLPFSMASGSVDRAAQALVVDPGEATFVRCLGCIRTGYDVTDDQ